MRPEISAVLVSYRSGDLAVRALESFRADAARAGLACEAVAVVNSGDPAEAAALDAAADRVVVPGGNLGYAGGLNAGAAVARGGVLLLANPDLAFLPGSVAALAAAASEGGFAVVGPALFWDEAARLLLPPAEEPRPAGLLRRALVARPGAAGRLFRRDLRRALAQEALVRAGRTGEVSGLSGALMAVSRGTFERAGPLDERYPLYFEENDWQFRIRRAGGRLLLAGGARVVHRYAQSARKEPRAEGWFREGERRYFETHFGEAGRCALERAAPVAGPPEPAAADALGWGAEREVLVAVSPFPGFQPFVLARPAAGETSFALPEEIRRGHEGSAWFARAVDARTFETIAEAKLASGPPAGDAAPPPRIGPLRTVEENPIPEERLLPYHATRFAAERVLVLAPHADDETIGCGGTLAGLIRDGAAVEVLVVTDGAAGEADPGRRRETGELRLGESRGALEVLGGGSVRCGFLPDRGLSARRADLARLLGEALRASRPQLVFVPSPVEVHPDHRAVAGAFLSLFGAGAGSSLSRDLPDGAAAAFYEVSQPIRPNVLVDITADAGRKQEALAVHASQLGGHDYAAFTRGLGEYRRMSLPANVTAAEAFFVVPLARLDGIPPERLAGAIGPTVLADELLSGAPGAAAAGRDEEGDRRAAALAERASIVVVNYNGRHHLEKCLPSLERSVPRAGEVILADNGSSDDSVQWVRANHPSVRVLPMGANLGFGEANRRGALEARGDFLVLLNSDTEVEEGWLAPLLAALHEEPEVAASCSTLRLMATPELLNGLGGGMSRLAYAFDHGFRFPYEPWTPRSGEPRRRDVLFPTAAAMAMRRREFFEYGGFDPAFFMYHEDVDLGWRLWLLGRRVVVCRDSVVAHAFGGTSKVERGLDWRLKLGVRHAVRSVLKHVEPLEAVSVLRWHAVLLARAGAWRLLAHVVAWNLAHLPGTLRRRFDLRSRATRTSAELRARGLVSRALHPPPPPEPPRFSGDPCDGWIPSSELLPGEFSGESRLGWGWYGRENDGGGWFRWTAGKARFGLRVAPGARGTLRLEVKASLAAPRGEMRLSCAGLTSLLAIDGETWQVVETPAQAGPDGLLDVVLESPAAVPDEVAGNWDFRRLGAAVRSVRFLASEPAARTAAGTVSVVIPTYNRKDVLEETVRALARQTVAPLEAIVVDDGSTDGTWELLLSLREELRGRLDLVPVRQENLRQGRARNNGVGRARGDLVLFLGDDTIPEPACVAEHLAARETRPGPCAVIGFTGWHRGKMRVTPFLDFVNGHGPQFSFDFLADGQEVPFTTLYTSNVSIPRDALGLEPFDHRFTSYGWEDCELGWRLSSAGLPIVYRKAAATRHVHPQTMSQFLARQAHVGRAIDVLYEIHPGLDGSPWLPPRQARFRHRVFSFAYRATAVLAAGLDRAGVRLPIRLYHALVAWAFHSRR
jgi:hypothetical protein